MSNIRLNYYLSNSFNFKRFYCVDKTQELDNFCLSFIISKCSLSDTVTAKTVRLNTWITILFLVMKCTFVPIPSFGY